jgi:hypothetical protein
MTSMDNTMGLNLVDTTARTGERWARARFLLWGLMVCCWLLDGLALGRVVNGDTISYMDIATECTKGHWQALVNGYWSPLYPALLSTWWSIVGHSLHWEALLVSLLDCLILIGALCCLEYFLTGLFDWLNTVSFRSDDGVPLPKPALRAICYALFFWVTIFVHAPSDHRPDTLVMTTVILSGGIIVRIANGNDGWLQFATLGVVLGFGYLSKAVMFPLAFVFLAAAFVASGLSARAVTRVILGFLFFLLISAPFALLLSRSKGRLTFGEVGKINYAEAVNHVRGLSHWEGETPGVGTPKHPDRKIFKVPPVYEFADPVGGSYPPFYDQSYWYDGVRPHFQLRGQLSVLHRSADSYFDLFLVTLGSLSAGFFTLLFWSGGLQSFVGRLTGGVAVWGPAIAGLGLYALVHIEGRFLGGFLILLWAGLFTALRIPRLHSWQAFVRAVTLASVLMLGAQATWSLAHDAFRLPSVNDFPDWEVARALRAEGVVPGDRVAEFDPGWITIHYWAHLAEVKIVAEIPFDGAPDFWQSSPEVQSQVLNVIARTGAKVVVARDVPMLFRDRGWKQVPRSPYYIHLLAR